MKILVIHAHTIDDYPPTYNLIRNLLDHGHQVTLMSYDSGKLKHNTEKNFFNCEIKGTWGSLSVTEKANFNFFQKIKMYFTQKKTFQDCFLSNSVNQDLIWITSSKAIHMLGDLLIGQKYILQLMELERDIPKYPKQHLVMMGLSKYARGAYKVVVPEYNRGQILKAWWGLEQNPIVLPNKPYSLSLEKLNDKEKEKYKIICDEKRKIILYQGVFGNDRNLTEYAKAAYSLKDKFAFYLLGEAKNKKIQVELEKQISCNPETKILGFISPPNHLYFTQLAWIGLLPYQAKIVDDMDILNAVYCAPNKIYEYAAYGVPMLGPDLPGLHYPFMQYNMGRCVNSVSSESIVNAILEIDRHHDEMSRNCKAFYNSVDMGQLVEQIIH